MKLRSAALSDLGKLRSENQDRCIRDEWLGLFGVADGVSGLPAGADAAQAAVDALVAAFRRLDPETDPDLAEIVRQVSRAVTERGLDVSPLLGIATTLVFGWASEGRLRIAHVGDSRCYALQSGKFGCLTEDHSAENEARRLRRPLPYAGVNRGALVRCVGQLPLPVADLIDRPLQAGDRFLFCTDGVTRVVTEAELRALVAGAAEPAPMLQELIALVLRRGAPDNARAVLLLVDEA
ncbi:MAG TPA: PP2C family serine/threonine-protein phosphatase [Opitutaceae bacterium]|nr:PP2C family serine/threonine-protein phosphatase [Opitutaceae bacterium]